MMALSVSTVDPLRMRSILGRKEWSVPTEYGPAGWRIERRDRASEILVSEADFDGVEYIHASFANGDRVTMPTYGDLVILHRAVFGDGYAYQVFAPLTHHVNIHPTALHLWGRSDGQPVLPEFGIGGTI
ncbi:hypothetical protein BCA37_10595 [Mycobacterium sp. djl-10]|nr:hypothetical protein BCA37_10595 [Mycobacterium sp. djl-10]